VRPPVSAAGLLSGGDGERAGWAEWNPAIEFRWTGGRLLFSGPIAAGDRGVLAEDLRGGAGA